MLIILSHCLQYMWDPDANIREYLWGQTIVIIYHIKERVKTTSTVYECTKHLIYEKVITE